MMQRTVDDRNPTADAEAAVDDAGQHILRAPALLLVGKGDFTALSLVVGLFLAARQLRRLG
jgi:hypothetical protein